MKQMSSLTVVVPCYNEELRFPQSRFVEAAMGDPTLKFVFVDDGSRDGTRSMLLHLRAYLGEQVTVLGLDANCGKAEAVRRGLQLAFEGAPDLVAYIDADLATPLAELQPMRALLMHRPELHAVLGSRVALLGRDVVRRPARHYFGRVFATLASLSLDLTVYDTQCGAKVFRNTAPVRSVFEHPFHGSWTFDVEILTRLSALSKEGSISPVTQTVAEYPLSRWHDVAGSKVALADALKAMVELMELRLRYRNGWSRQGSEEVRDTVRPATGEVQNSGVTARTWVPARPDSEVEEAPLRSEPPQSATRRVVAGQGVRVA